jgi:peptide/nickel transport system ATP-binding protein
MQQETLLEFKNLVTEFKLGEEVIKAVNDITFTVNKGETVGIVGESGSGKSITALSAMRLLPKPGQIVSGQILFHSRSLGTLDLSSIPESTMRKLRGNELAMIFQEPMTSLNPVYTCGDQVMEAIMLHQKVSKSEAKSRTIKLFEEVKLPRPEILFNTYPHQISGGQKQRVMIAMAMSCNPSVLIADEPTTALDVTVQKTILDLMLELQQRHNMGIMFITHDLGVIAELADKVVVMYKGKIVEQGSVLEIFTKPQHPYTKGLLACRPPLNKKLQWLPTVNDFMKVNSEGIMAEINVSIADVINKLVISPTEIEQRRERLYQNNPILEVKNLKTYFPINNSFFTRKKEYIKVLDDVSFEVYPGETLGLVGESGCGKTTLGRTILRLIEPTDGQILFEGKDLISMSASELRMLRKNIQIIFQDPYSSLNPRLTIGEAIIEPMRVHGIGENDQERKARAIELLERVNMNVSHFYRYPHEFSGGQRQRVCIARSLALKPKFIICDESVSALDVSVQAQVLNLLNELRDEFNFTYIFISHDLSVVKFMSDRMIVMNKGRVEEMGFAEQIYLNPQSDYTKKLINAIPKGEVDDILKSINRKKSIKSINTE